jgi:hypothetical protein
MASWRQMCFDTNGLGYRPEAPFAVEELTQYLRMLLQLAVQKGECKERPK